MLRLLRLHWQPEPAATEGQASLGPGLLLGRRVLLLVGPFKLSLSGMIVRIITSANLKGSLKLGYPITVTLDFGHYH